MDSQQSLVLNILETGSNVFLTGQAGTGKSFTIERVVRTIDDVFCTASTGVAACLLKVTCPVLTLHAWAGIGLGDAPVMACVRKIKNNRKTFARIRSTNILVVDEVSMLDAKYFDKVSTVLKVLLNSSAPFGGIQLLLCGDFLQLPPPKGNFVFESSTWKELDLCNINLKTIYRQSDPQFTNILQSLRVGQITQDVKTFFREKKLCNSVENKGIIPTKLFCTNVDVDRINNEELSKLTGDSISYRAMDLGKPCSNLPEKLNLKLGAQVMLLTNLDIENELVNGSRGVVTCIDPVFVQFVNAMQIEISPIIQTNKDSKTETKWKREQIPLRLAWASTIHKSQGASIDLLEVDLKGAFADGQVYTAISRCRNSNCISIRNFPPQTSKGFKQSIKVLSKYLIKWSINF